CFPFLSVNIGVSPCFFLYLYYTIFPLFCKVRQRAQNFRPEPFVSGLNLPLREVLIIHPSQTQYQPIFNILFLDFSHLLRYNCGELKKGKLK
ncbi:MAG: hypothetical protein IKK74_09810, partial [Clostridia bacterium]|nr:hypothetical protein [Clostridia bacterium]